MKSLDKNKTKELDWEKRLKKDGEKLADNLMKYNGIRLCKVCGNEPEQQARWIIGFVKKQLQKQKEQILNLECLKDEKIDYNCQLVFLSDFRNKLRKEIKEEIEKL